MAPLPCTELGDSDRRTLLALARETIIASCAGEAPPVPKMSRLSPLLRMPRAVFVTLKINERLRGCIGSLVATHPLAESVVEAALGAAQRDPRFPALKDSELKWVKIEVSVLSPFEALPADSRSALVDALQPGVDGLVLEDGPRRATFLPSVWEQIPDPEQFLSQLLRKAGLPADHWSDSLRAQRYRSERFAEA